VEVARRSVRRARRFPRRLWPRDVNLSRSPSANYAAVQDEIAAAVLRHLPPHVVTVSDRGGRDGAVNLSLFIGDHSADVLLSHGLADKRYLWRRDAETKQPLLNGFDHVLVPGPWLRDRLLATRDIALGPDRIHIVGWPRLDPLLAQRPAAAIDADVPRRRLRVLWAPTHDYRKRGPQQLPVSSYPAFEQHLPSLREHADVAVSVHPRNRRDKRPTSDLLLWADVVISDFGTMVYEAWALGKPVLFPFWLVGDLVIEQQRHSTEAEIYRRRIGHHPTSIDELIDLVAAGPTLTPDVTAFMDRYLDPRFHGTAGRRAACVLDHIRRGRVPPV
jgi:hypothetical protein